MGYLSVKRLENKLDTMGEKAPGNFSKKIGAKFKPAKLAKRGKKMKGMKPLTFNKKV